MINYSCRVWEDVLCIFLYLSIYVLVPFIRTSKPSRHFIYCIYGSLSDSPVCIKPVYFHPSLRIIPEVQQRSPSAVVRLLSYTFSMWCSFLLKGWDEIWEPVSLCGELINLSACLCIVVQQRLKSISQQLQQDSKSCSRLPRTHTQKKNSLSSMWFWSFLQEHWMEEKVKEIVFEYGAITQGRQDSDFTLHAPLPRT